MPRVYTHKFDWDEARARRAAGETIAALAHEYGVTSGAVYFAVNDEARDLQHARGTEWQKSGVCRDCGKQGVVPQNGTRGSEGRCRKCAAAELITSVRPDELMCTGCREWKQDDKFPHHVRMDYRRFRHRTCTSCQTKSKADWRRRNAEKQRAYDREYSQRARDARPPDG